jgi:hypothetical protein
VGQAPREIEREIEATRERLTVHLDELMEKVDPRRVARSAAGAAKVKFFATIRRATGG